VDLGSVVGSGPSGLILLEDVLKAESAWAVHGAQNGAKSAPVAPAPPPLAGDAVVTTIKGPAAALAGAMEQSLTIPTATSFRTLAVGTLEARRADLNRARSRPS
jgi:2-oxoglutarate decarboxylase